jgi:hypothetical protein
LSTAFAQTLMERRSGGTVRMRGSVAATGFRGSGCVTGVEEKNGRGAHEGTAADSYD